VRRPRRRLALLPALSLGTSLIFFVTSNFATWAEGLLYPRTFSGLMTCYYMALPFLRNTVVADLLGTALLFSIGPILENAYERLNRPRPIENA
jgi:hypothetical protein